MQLPKKECDDVNETGYDQLTEQEGREKDKVWFYSAQVGVNSLTFAILKCTLACT